MTSVVACAVTAAALLTFQPGPARDHRRDDGCRKHCQDSGDGDRKGNRYCFMPCDFVIIIPPAERGPEEQAALFPPDPAKLVSVIQTGAAAIGKAAGDLAGAAAALPVGILL